MKRIISCILVFILLCGVIPAIGFAEDYTSMTDDELQNILNAVRNELTARGLKAEDKTVLVDESGVQIYINGEMTVEAEWSGDLECNIPIVIVNNTSHDITIGLRDPSVNGWSCDGSVYPNDVPAGKKAKSTLSFELGDTDVTSLDDFEDAEFRLNVYDEHSWDDLFTTDIITIRK